MIPRLRGPAVVLVLILFVLTALLSVPALAYKLEHDDRGHVLHWSSEDFPVPYKVARTSPVPFGTFKWVTEASFGTWQAVRDAAITFHFTGATDKKSPAFDGENCVLMGKKVSGPDVIGQAYIFYSTEDGRILDVDIVLNSSYPWATDGSPKKMDVQNALTHEIGHFCGLDDLYGKEDREKTMYGYMGYGEIKKRTLTSDDAAGLAAIYPIGHSKESGGGGGGSGCGTISPTASPPRNGTINFLWIFLLLACLGARRLLRAPFGDWGIRDKS